MNDPQPHTTAETKPKGRKAKDSAGQWLISKHPGLLLRRILGLANLRDFKFDHASLPTAKFPDALFQVWSHDDPPGDEGAHPVLVEIAALPEERIRDQMVNGIALTRMPRGQILAAYVVAMSPKGNAQVPSSHSEISPDGRSGLHCWWTVIKLWEMNARDFLENFEPGLAPWVGLMFYDGPPEELADRICEALERTAQDQTELTNLKALTRLMFWTKYKDAQLADRIFSNQGVQRMFQTLDETIREMMQDMMTNGFTLEQRKDLYKFIKEFEAEQKGRKEGELTGRRASIKDFYQDRFGSDLPQDAAQILDKTTDAETLRQWSKTVAAAPTSEAFLKTLSPDAAPKPARSRKPKPKSQ